MAFRTLKTGLLGLVLALFLPFAIRGEDTTTCSGGTCSLGTCPAKCPGKCSSGCDSGACNTLLHAKPGNCDRIQYPEKLEVYLASLDPEIPAELFTIDSIYCRGTGAGNKQELPQWLDKTLCDAIIKIGILSDSMVSKIPNTEQAISLTPVKLLVLAPPGKPLFHLSLKNASFKTDKILSELSAPLKAEVLAYPLMKPFPIKDPVTGNDIPGWWQSEGTITLSSKCGCPTGKSSGL